MQPLKKIISTIDNLKCTRVFNKISEILVAKFELIQFNNNAYDTTILSPNDRLLYYAGQNPIFWLDEKFANPKGQYNTRAKYKRIDKILKLDSTKNFSNLLNEINIKMNRKIEELQK